MENSIRFIFIVPVGPGHEKYVYQWKNSLASQDYDNHELSMPRDTDGKGQVFWLNTCLDQLLLTGRETHTYINFMGVDDYLQDGVLNILNHVILSNDCPKWLYGGHFQTSGKRRIETTNVSQPWDYKRLKRENYIAGGAVFVRSDMYLNRRFRDLWTGQAGDWDMWLRLGKESVPMRTSLMIYTERINTSLIRMRPGSIKSKIFNRVKYPIWRVQRGLWRLKQ